MKKLPYFPFYPGEWLRSPTVMGMPLDEQGAYLRLLCWQWEDGYVNPEDIFLLLGCEQEVVDKWFAKRAWKRAFVVGDDGMLRNPRLAIEREAALNKCESASAAAHARWRKHREKGSPKQKRRNAETEMYNAIAKLDQDGAPLSSSLIEAMTAYMQLRRSKTGWSMWSTETWLKNLEGEFSDAELADAFKEATRCEWKSVHPKRAGSHKRKSHQALDTLKEWISDDDLPY